MTHAARAHRAGAALGAELLPGANVDLQLFVVHAPPRWTADPRTLVLAVVLVRAGSALPLVPPDEAAVARLPALGARWIRALLEAVVRTPTSRRALVLPAQQPGALRGLPVAVLGARTEALLESVVAPLATEKITVKRVFHGTSIIDKIPVLDLFFTCAVLQINAFPCQRGGRQKKKDQKYDAH